MLGFHTPALLFLLTTLFVAPAHADESGLDGSYEIAPAEQPNTYVPEAAPNSSPETAPPADDEAPPAPVVLHAKESPRFTAEESARLRHWLLELCRQDAVAPETANRVRFGRDATRVEITAGNKQGTLVLLLDNYAELATFRDHCETARKGNSEACMERGRLPKPGISPDVIHHPWLNFGSSKFWSEVNSGRTPAGIEAKVDLLRETKEQVKVIQAVLKKDFFDFRDAADLGGKPGSGATARELSALVRSQTACGTRAITEHSRNQK